MIWLWTILGIIGYYLGLTITVVLAYKILNFDEEKSIFFSIFWPVTILFIPVRIAGDIIGYGCSDELETPLIQDFQELSESEDERIREALVEFISHNSDTPFSLYDKFTPLQIIVWLEKQKEASKAIVAVERIDKYIDENITNAHEMKRSNRDKKYCQGVDDTLCDIIMILNNVAINPDGSSSKCSSQVASTLSDSRWIPNDAQLRCLKYAINKYSSYEAKHKVLKSLYNDLKEYISKSQSDWIDYDESNLLTRFAFYTYKDEPEVLYLANVFVEDASRGNGYGTRILNAAEKVAISMGALQIRLKVKKEPSVINFYIENGYNYLSSEKDYEWFEKKLDSIYTSKLSIPDKRMFNSIIERGCCEVPHCSSALLSE